MLQPKSSLQTSLKYDPSSIEKRANKRKIEMIQFIKLEKRDMNSILELGLREGKVCHLLQKMGKKNNWY